jgi:hypothetical protein
MVGFLDASCGEFPRISILDEKKRKTEGIR